MTAFSSYTHLCSGGKPEMEFIRLSSMPFHRYAASHCCVFARFLYHRHLHCGLSSTSPTSSWHTLCGGFFAARRGHQLTQQLARQFFGFTASLGSCSAAFQASPAHLSAALQLLALVRFTMQWRYGASAPPARLEEQFGSSLVSPLSWALSLWRFAFINFISI